MMAFTHDVFLSYSSADKAVVQPLAERLRSDGLRVWFDQWEVRPGDNIPAKIEEGLEGSRTLVVCMSAAAFGSDWARLERYAFQFRDPENRERRLIPLRLDNTEPRALLAQLMYVDWRSGRTGDEGRDKSTSYAKLVDACRLPVTEIPAIDSKEEDVERGVEGGLWARDGMLTVGHRAGVTSVVFSADGRYALSGSADKTMLYWEVATGRALRAFEGHADSVTSVALSADGCYALSGSADKTIRYWEVATGRALRVLEGHTDSVTSVAFSTDGRALSGSVDKTVRLWEIATGYMLLMFEGNSGLVRSVSFSTDNQRALSSSTYRTVHFWDVTAGSALGVGEGHTSTVMSVAFSPNGRCALSGSADNTARLWDVATGRELHVFEGHTRWVTSVALSADGRYALSGSADKTVRLWEIATGQELRIFKGHTGAVAGVAFSPNDRQALSASEDRTVRRWEISTGRMLGVFEVHTHILRSAAFSADGLRTLSSSMDGTVGYWNSFTGHALRVFESHKGWATSTALSTDGQYALSGADDNIVRLWEVTTERAPTVLEGHTGVVWSTAFSADSRHALSGSGDKTIRYWEIPTGQLLRVFEGHTGSVTSVVFSTNGHHALSGSDDKTLRYWEITTGRMLCVFEGHSENVTSVTLSSDGRYAISGSNDSTVRLWEVTTGRAHAVFEGHTAAVLCVALSADGSRALSGSNDGTVRLWEVATGRTLGVFESHTHAIMSVAFSANSRYGFMATSNGILRAWELPNTALHIPLNTDPTSLTRSKIETAISEQLQYTNAKVLLVGDSGAGKTGLSMRLAENAWRDSDSTVGAWATQWRLSPSAANGIEREIWLWDFGGQADQRLIHQLFMDETRLVVLVFDPQKDELFDALDQWDRDLARVMKQGVLPAKLLVAGRIDAGRLRVARSQVEAFATERGFVTYLETSAKLGIGCNELRDAIMNAIRWDELPWRSSPRLFKRLKDEIVRFKDEGRVLMRFKDLRDALALRIRGMSFRDEELEAVLGLLEGPAVISKLPFGSWVLLQPERVNAYAQAVIQTVRADQRDLGTIAEEKVLRGDLTYQSSLPRLSAEDERIVLLAMHQLLVERGLCLRQHTEHGTHLVFPSFYRRERPDIVGQPAVLVSYRFDGFLDDIYATLIVHLHHATSFEQADLWRYAADFRTLTGKRMGVRLTRRAAGTGELEVYFDPDIAVEEQIIFSKYVHEHLLRTVGESVVRLRHYVCRVCKTPVGNREVAMSRLARGRDDIVCVECEARVLLWDELEQYFAKPEVARQVEEREERARVVLDAESKERVLIGDVISTVALAGQISRELSVSDHGIDMEIEFKSDTGEATGKKLYLQLKSGDSHLSHRRIGAKSVEVFVIKDERHARYWMNQAFPVMLVVRSSDGIVRWMDIREYLRRESTGNRNAVRRIVFTAERFDVMSVRRWRDRVIDT